jgi:hypothetical protein
LGDTCTGISSPLSRIRQRTPPLTTDPTATAEAVNTDLAGARAVASSAAEARSSAAADRSGSGAPSDRSVQAVAAAAAIEQGAVT